MTDPAFLAELIERLKGRAQWYNDAHPATVKTPELLREAAAVLDQAAAAESTVAALRSELEEAKRALKPFADEAEELPNSVVNIRFSYEIDGISYTTFFDSSDLRAARAALATATGEKPADEAQQRIDDYHWMES